MYLSFIILKYMAVPASNGDYMPRIISLLKLKKDAPLAEEDSEGKCAKCGRRSTTGQDGLCDQCRFSDVLTQLTEERQS
jgi:hypothetical protein